MVEIFETDAKNFHTKKEDKFRQKQILCLCIEKEYKEINFWQELFMKKYLI